VVGSVFFGSSLFILQRIADEIGVDLKSEGNPDVDPSIHRPTYFASRMPIHETNHNTIVAKRLPSNYVVLDLTRVTNLDGR
jgi:hypothetical protein